MKTTSYLILITFMILSCVGQRCYSQNSNNFVEDSRDGQVYKTIEIGDQTWMAENLNYNATDSWWYDNKEENGKKYGRLYTWEAATTACPQGWQLSSDEDWQILEENLGLPKDELLTKGWRGEAINIASKFDWLSKTDSITSQSLRILPSGYRKHMQIAFFINTISFNNLELQTGFWTSTKTVGNAYYRFFEEGKSGIFRYHSFKKTGFCVRCVKK